MVFEDYDFAFVLGLLFCGVPSKAQGNAGSIEGTVKDPSESSVANATVEISYPVSGYTRTVATGADGSFRFRMCHSILTILS